MQTRSCGNKCMLPAGKYGCKVAKRYKCAPADAPDLKAQNKQLEAENKQLKETVQNKANNEAAQKSGLAFKDSVIATLALQVNRLEEEHKNDMEEAENHIVAISEENMRRGVELGEMQESLLGLKKEAEELRKLRERSEADILDLKQTVGSRQEKLDELEWTIRRLLDEDEQRCQTTAALRESDEAIMHKVSELEEKKQHIRDMEEAMLEKKREIRDLEDKVEAQEKLLGDKIQDLRLTQEALDIALTQVKQHDYRLMIRENAVRQLQEEVDRRDNVISSMKNAGETLRMAAGVFMQALDA